MIKPVASIESPKASRRRVWGMVVLVTAAFGIGLLSPPPLHGVVDLNDGMMVSALAIMAGFIGTLWVRMNRLEDSIQAMREQNGTLIDKLGAAASFINRVGFWVSEGCPPLKRPKLPEQLESHVDVELWPSNLDGSE